MNLSVNIDKHLFLSCFSPTIRYLMERRNCIYAKTHEDVSNFFLEDVVARAVGEFLYLMVTFNDANPQSFWDNVFEEYLMADIFADDTAAFGRVVIGDMIRFVPSVQNQLGIIGRTLNDRELELEMTLTMYFEECSMVTFVFQAVPEPVEGNYAHSSAIL